jgi:hypothetical protein
MFLKFELKNLIVFVLVLAISACSASKPSSDKTATLPAVDSQNGFSDKPAIPNDSGIEGVQTFPDKAAYHDHVDVVPDPGGDLPPTFGAHYSKWQNCGIYDQPVDLGNALHSMEHGAVWLTYSPDLEAQQITDLQNLVRGHGYVLMSPYAKQTVPVALTAWGVQLAISFLPDGRIAKFIDYYHLFDASDHRDRISCGRYFIAITRYAGKYSALKVEEWCIAG